MLRRLFSSETATQPTLAQLVQQLRKETSAPIAKARAALQNNKNDYQKALAELKTLAQKTSEKVANRAAREGLVAVSIARNQAAMIEINCETDFVQRSDLFKDCVRDVRATLNHNQLPLVSTSTTGIFREIEQNALESWVETATLSSNSKSVKERVVEGIGKMGENIKVRRAFASFASPAESSSKQERIIYGGYTHGGEDLMGKIAALVALRVVASEPPPETIAALEKLARQLAQQVVGFNPSVTQESHLPPPRENLSPDDLDGLVLYRQQFLAGGGDKSVAHVLDSFRDEHNLAVLEVSEFRRVVCGEGVDVKESNFAEEVMQQAGLRN